MAAPIPLDAPVTTAIFPVNRCDMKSSFVGFLYLSVQMRRTRDRVDILYRRVRKWPYSSYNGDVQTNGSPKAIGRPRSFDTSKALDRALDVFWRKGYEGASLSDLTKAMRINRPSLYAAFGDKGKLFRKVLDRYAEGPASYSIAALQEPTSRAVVERLLYGTADHLTSPQNPRACLWVQGALACGNGAESVREELTSRRMAREAALHRRLSRARMDGDLPPEANPASLARYIVTVIQGMSIQAAGGATRNELRRVIDIALQSWPSPRNA
jgi:AcrR family transcriptional regulator